MTTEVAFHSWKHIGKIILQKGNFVNNKWEMKIFYEDEKRAFKSEQYEVWVQIFSLYMWMNPQKFINIQT